MLVLPVFVAIGTGAVIVAVVSILATPHAENSERGVAANGFSAYVEKDADLGAGKIVTRGNVVDALGDNAKSVSSAEVNKVFNYDGNRGQAVTFKFTREDNVKATLYIDMMKFKDTVAMNNANIYIATGKAGKIKGHPAYYMHAQTLGTVRQYRVMVVDGLTAYQFIIEQPIDNITISEVAADAALIRLARQANL